MTQFVGKIKLLEERCDSCFTSLETRLDVLNDDFKNIQKSQASSHEAEEAHDMDFDVSETSWFNNYVHVFEENNEELRGEIDGKSTHILFVYF